MVIIRSAAANWGKSCGPRSGLGPPRGRPKKKESSWLARKRWSWMLRCHAMKQSSRRDRGGIPRSFSESFLVRFPKSLKDLIKKIVPKSAKPAIAFSLFSSKLATRRRRRRRRRDPFSESYLYEAQEASLLLRLQWKRVEGEKVNDSRRRERERERLTDSGPSSSFADLFSRAFFERGKICAAKENVLD